MSYCSAMMTSINYHMLKGCNSRLGGGCPGSCLEGVLDGVLVDLFTLLSFVHLHSQHVVSAIPDFVNLTFFGFRDCLLLLAS